MSERVCEMCRHWHRIDPGVPRGPVVLTGQDPQQAVGECRRELVTVALPTGQLMSLYARTPGLLPACSHFTPRPNGAV